MVDISRLLPQDEPTHWAGVEERLTVLGATASLTVTMLGTGIVAFPSGFALCGYLIAPIAVVFLAALAHVSYVSLMRCTASERVASYGSLVQRLPGAWSHYTNAALCLLLILALTAYVLIAADIIRSIVWKGSDTYPLVLQDHVLFAVILLFILPLCLSRTLHGLTLISTYCSFAILGVVGIIVWRCFWLIVHEPLPPGTYPTHHAHIRPVVLAVPIFGCAMFGHMNASQVYAELRPAAKAHAQLVSLAACAGTMVLYVIVGGVGYAAFGSAALPDVVAQIAMRCGETGDVAIMHGLLASFIVLKTPLLVLPLRSLALPLFCRALEPGKLAWQPNLLITSSLLGCVYFVAVALPNLDGTLEISGALCVMPLCFIVPARLSWSIESPRPSVKCILLIAFGVIGSFLSLLDVVAP
mmetsp:Transcript_70481/g.139852  ORF Transcript_70481/g.139852 Transcript_70481/m.139852 type:complete len:413 (-) Transcript_70481:53-1291(-)